MSCVVGGRGKWTVVGGGRRSSSGVSRAVGGGGEVKVTFFVGAGGEVGGGVESWSGCGGVLLKGSSLNDPWTAPWSNVDFFSNLSISPGDNPFSSSFRSSSISSCDMFASLCSFSSLILCRSLSSSSLPFVLAAAAACLRWASRSCCARCRNFEGPRFLCAGKPVAVAFAAFGARTGAVGVEETGFSVMSLMKLGFALRVGPCRVSSSESLSSGIVNFSPGIRSIVGGGAEGVDGGGIGGICRVSPLFDLGKEPHAT